MYKWLRICKIKIRFYTMEERTIVFIVTKDCQLSCRYCYLVAKNHNEEMSFPVAQKTIDYLFSSRILSSNTSIIYDFIGGEPLLRIGLIDMIMEYAITCKHNIYNISNYKIRITTNGILYNDNEVQKFIKKYQQNLLISISIDGTKEKNDLNRIYKNGRGSYDNIINNVKLWRKQFPTLGTRMTISHGDIPYVCDSVKHLISLGIKKIDVNPVLEDVWRDGDDHLLETQLIMIADYIVESDLFLDKDVDLTCFDDFIGHPLEGKDMNNPCGSMFLAIDAKGNFYTCMRFAKYSLRSKLPRIVGNVENGIDSNKLRPLHALDLQALYPKECLTCEIATGCKWCPAENYDASSTGTIYQRSTATCKIHHAKVRAKNYYWNKLYKRING